MAAPDKTKAELRTITIQRVGEGLRVAREFSRISKANLACAINANAGRIAQIETGKTEPSAGELYRLAKVLNVEVSFFFSGLDRDATA